jgi:hypothetical protein
MADRHVTTLRERIPSTVEMIDTGHGLVENQFKEINTIQGSQISHVISIFENISIHIMEILDQYYETFGAKNIYLLGCIAWLSDKDILATMAKAAGVLILVNDEDFSKWGQKRSLAKLYDELPRIKEPFSVIFKHSVNVQLKTIPSGDGKTNFCGAIRVVGTRPVNTTLTLLDEDDDEDDASADGMDVPTTPAPTTPNKRRPKSSVFQKGPILHSKYLIPCYWEGINTQFTPLGVFTGSYNYTMNARQNQENVVWIASEDEGNIYLNDFVRSFAVSRPIRR